MAEIILDEVKFIASVGEIEAAGMTQHVWVNRRQAGACGSAAIR